MKVNQSSKNQHKGTMQLQHPAKSPGFYRPLVFNIPFHNWHAEISRFTNHRVFFDVMLMLLFLLLYNDFKLQQNWSIQ